MATSLVGGQSLCFNDEVPPGFLAAYKISVAKERACNVSNTHKHSDNNILRNELFIWRTTKFMKHCDESVRGRSSFETPSLDKSCINWCQSIIQLKISTMQRSSENKLLNIFLQFATVTTAQFTLPLLCFPRNPILMYEKWVIWIIKRVAGKNC